MIGIVVSLATVSLFAVRGITNAVHETSCVQQQRVVTTAVESYLAEHQIDRLPTPGPMDVDAIEVGLDTAPAVDDPAAYYRVAADGSLATRTSSPCS